MFLMAPTLYKSRDAPEKIPIYSALLSTFMDLVQYDMDLVQYEIGFVTYSLYLRSHSQRILRVKMARFFPKQFSRILKSLPFFALHTHL